MTFEQDLLKDNRLSEELSVIHPLGRDEFLYDLIGINIIGLKSLGVLIKTPAVYFKAALTPDWEGKYWPSMRIWFGLMTIMIGLQFLWASESSEMTAMFRTLAGTLADGALAGAERDGRTLDLSSFDRVEAGKKMFKNYIFIYPFFFVSFMCLLGFIFRGWEQKLPYIARVRYIFAIIVPGSIIGLLTIFVMLPLKGQTYQIASAVVMPFIFLAYWVTSYRGAFTSTSKGTKLGMSFVISLLIMFTLLIAQVVSMMLAAIPIVFEIKEMIKLQK